MNSSDNKRFCNPTVFDSVIAHGMYLKTGKFLAIKIFGRVCKYEQ